MKSESALSLLKDGELCIVTTAQGEREMRWSVPNRCFYYSRCGTPVVCPVDEIEEWRPVVLRRA
ncbi:MAG TPA: hypothetical protein VEC01_06650 [Noviherbaspirillum sp.]|uniref:hypothetical protein n=1 Tax=Noviherbaspirillum sp. TaxID=1926288 RepID=UPI002D4ED5A4|nr:hypothetical protein [Noviherbaspirillum sp.]HYD94987.1 hypothetical protein [Noviherbaspirillum sp.]